MRTFRSKSNFVPASIPENSPLHKEVVIIANTDYEIIDTNQAFGVYVKVFVNKALADKFGLDNDRVYISREEIEKFGIVQNKLTKEELKSILSKISLDGSCVNFDWNWEIREVTGMCVSTDPNFNTPSSVHGFLINTTFSRPDIKTGIIGIGKGRQMWIEDTASETSVVMTAWLCVDLIVKHEAMEAFKYRNAQVLNPHKSLVELTYPQYMSDNKDLADATNTKEVKHESGK